MIRKISLLCCLLLASALVQAGDEAASQVEHLVAADIAAGRATLPATGAVSTGQPNAAALQKVADAGYAAVIDLRSATEERGLDEKATVEALGMQYLALPVNGADDVNYQKAAEFDRLLEQVQGPVLVHCGSGNRVGALYALRDRLHGASPEAALETGKRAGLTGLEPIVRERLEETP